MTNGPKDISDDQLVQAFCHKADDAAFRNIFDRYYTPLTLFAARFITDPDAASDVVQNLFVSLYEKRDSLQISSLKSFLFSSVRNACLNTLKHEKIKRSYESDSLADASELAPDADAADNLIQQAEAQAKIAAALAQLPAQCQRIFALSRFDGLSNQEIADKLCISKRTVETQVSNALKALRRILLSLALILISIL